MWHICGVQTKTLDILNDLSEQLSSCPAKTKEFCRTVHRTVWGAISSFSSTLSTSLDSVEGGSCGVGPSSIAAIRTGGSGDGRHNSIMGSVRSRPITSDDTTSVDGTNTVTCSSPSSFQQHHSKSKSFCGNGGSYLQKNDLRYDIGAASQYHPVRQPSVRSRNQQPMPSPEELDRKFTKVLVSIFCRFLCFV